MNNIGVKAIARVYDQNRLEPTNVVALSKLQQNTLNTSNQNKSRNLGIARKLNFRALEIVILCSMVPLQTKLNQTNETRKGIRNQHSHLGID